MSADDPVATFINQSIMKRAHLHVPANSEFRQCDLCYNDYDMSDHVPMTLVCGCGYSMCSMCLNGLPQQKQKQKLDVIKCPSCRKDTLRRNAFVNRLARDLMQQAVQPATDALSDKDEASNNQTNSPCDRCLQDDLFNKSVSYCFDCEPWTWMCGPHSELHKLQHSSHSGLYSCEELLEYAAQGQPVSESNDQETNQSNNQPIKQSNNQSNSQSDRFPITECVIHPCKPRRSFCVNCDELLCSQCILPFHAEHEIQDVQSAWQEKCDGVIMLEQQYIAYGENQDNAGKQLKNVLDWATSNEKMLNDAAERIIDRIRWEVRFTVDCLKDLTSTQREDYDRLIDPQSAYSHLTLQFNDLIQAIQSHDISQIKPLFTSLQAGLEQCTSSNALSTSLAADTLTLLSDSTLQDFGPKISGAFAAVRHESRVMFDMYTNLEFLFDLFESPVLSSASVSHLSHTCPPDGFILNLIDSVSTFPPTPALQPAPILPRLSSQNRFVDDIELELLLDD